ncbi:hypothetical protein F4778DRAFT_781973 [Xylariomycetidae sp. FL2044]|nr:hypothetical protein F4778DRAFT_781973 [Xylariomycetidae sp. FL2044]
MSFVTDDKFIFSYTYHIPTLNNIYNYYLLIGDLKRPQLAIAKTGLASVTARPNCDWLRLENGRFGYNIEANSILYCIRQNTLDLAAEVPDNNTTIVIPTP